MHQKVEALEYSGCKLERRSYLQTLSKKLSSRFGLTPFEGPAENDNPVLTWSADYPVLLLQDKPRKPEEWSFPGEGLVSTGCSWAPGCQGRALHLGDLACGPK